MIRTYAGLGIGLVLIGVITTMGAETQLIRVKGDHVNLRCRPVRESEVVCQATRGQQLISVIVQDEWYGVTPPTNASVWIHKDFVQNSAVVSKLNVRGGPGINFSSVGTLSKGDAVKILKTLGDWAQIEPPPGTLLWIHRDFVETATAAAVEVPPTPPVAAPPVLPVVAPKPMVTTAVVAEAPSPVQIFSNVSMTIVMPMETAASSTNAPAGKVWEGVVQPLDFLFNSAGNYRLVRQDSQGKTVVVCYLKGNSSQLASLVGHKVQVTGWDYWLSQSDLPTVVPETIAPVP